jgi:hypothetical protein
MKNRKREICTSGPVRDEDGNVLIYSANDRGDRGNVGIIRSPVRAPILPDLPRLLPDSIAESDARAASILVDELNAGFFQNPFDV